MSTVVYLSNKQIQVVTGTSGAKKVALKDCYMTEAPEGCMINGMIMDHDMFVTTMKNFWQANKLPTNDVCVVINSSKYVGKTIELPILKDDKALEFIQREFTDIDREEERVYGYIPLGTATDKKLKRVYAESVSAEFIKEYVDIFAEIGIKVKGIYSGESSIIGLTLMTVANQFKTFVLQIADNMTLTTILWVNGTFSYYNSIRCFHEQGTEEYALDVARSVSQIIQFMQAHQMEYPLEAIVMAGVNPQNIPIYQGALRQQGIQVNAMVFNDMQAIATLNNYDPQNFLFATSGLFSFGKWQNFLTNLHMVNKKYKKQGVAESKAVLQIAITAAVMLIILGICITIKIVKENDLQDLKDYNESEAVISQVAQVDVLSVRNDFLSSQYNSIVGVTDNINTYPICNNSIVSIIKKSAVGYADVTINSFDADSGEVAMTAEAEDVEQINKFIQVLNGQEIFENVDYTGYTFSEETKLWDIHVTCILQEAAGR